MQQKQQSAATNLLENNNLRRYAAEVLAESEVEVNACGQAETGQAQKQRHGQEQKQRQMTRTEGSSGRAMRDAVSDSDSYRRYICKSNKDAESASWLRSGRACERKT